MRKIAALAYNDFKNVFREPLLLYIMVLPILLSVGVRWMIPWLTLRIADDIDLKAFYPLIAGFFVLLSPILLGMVAGFLLLDERDDNTLVVLSVTPIGRTGYLTYRVTASTLISFLYAFIIIPIIGLTQMPILHLFPIALVGALSTPMVALLLGTFAGNKVEGIALSKGLGILMLAPFAGYFLTTKWRVLAGVVPFYWPVHAYIAAAKGLYIFWIYVVLGLIVHLFYLRLLLKRFLNRVN